MDNETLSALIANARTGDESAIAALIEVFGNEVREKSRSFRLDASHELSHSDLIQEAWIRIWSHINSFEGDNDATVTVKMFRRWLKTTARNVMTNMVKKALARKRSPPNGKHSLPEDIATSDPTPSEVFRTLEDVDKMRDAIERLPPTDKRIVQLCFYEGASYKQAAERLGLTYDQIRYRVGEIIVRLKAHLD